MKDILYRGMRRDNGEWIEGAAVKDPSIFGKTWIVEVINENIVNWHVIYPGTLGRFTGMHDKNGKKIFEDDVVKTKYGRLCVVVWFSSRAHCGWDLKPVDTVDNIVHRKPPTEYDLWEDKNLEVVGNIHDNPEFAEVK